MLVAGVFENTNTFVLYIEVIKWLVQLRKKVS